MDITVISGYKRSTAYTVALGVTTGTIITVPIYNTTWIIAVPKANQVNTRIKFKTYVFREVPIEKEDMAVRKIITGTITAGGLGIFLLTMLAILLVRRIKERIHAKKGKMSIFPQRRSEGKNVNEHTVLEQEEQNDENSVVDFEEFILIKSPKDSASQKEKMKKGDI